MNNKKGFTLVELLAVIVILALVMGIAVVSIGGVLQSSREKTFRETAASLVNGVRQQLYIENKVKAGYYCVTKDILEKGGKESPYGTDYKYECSGTNVGSAGTVKEMSGAPTGGCTATAPAYVHVTEAAGVFTYYICLADGTHYINEAEESTLLTNDGTKLAQIYPTPAS